MKRWAICTAFLYALALVLLTVPALLLAFGWNSRSGGSLALKDVLGLFKFWGYWLWLAVLVAGQILLLLVPMDISERRLPARRKLKFPVIVSAFFLANLCFAGVFSVVCAIFADRAYELYDVSALFAAGGRPAAGDSGWGALLTMIFTVLVFWLGWAVVFRKAAKPDDPGALLKRATRWLLRGSILELLVAVPSHVIVRRRGDCCAPMGTFWGIATGLSVMLLCFGPGVYFLFVERFRRLQPKPPGLKC